MEKILIIEDSKDVNDMICETLEAEGYEIQSEYDGLAGLKALKREAYDLLILDIMLPYHSGDEIIRELRTFSDMPVIILSAKDMISTKIDLLKLGADDYMTKPFDLGELAARVATHLRRTKKQKLTALTYTYKDVEMHVEEKRILVTGWELDLTAKEFRIMELLLKNKTKVFSKANFYETLWDEEYLGDDSAIKTHISNLRSKLKNVNPEGKYIETVWGIGYRLYKEELSV